ncbi:hypothetical protein [Ornithobacterium rhinotracheale]|uniref:hypothetical protein n=1 Tax=Ornithobacterium rhinotracheale TaxID=28251 RepID=UPI0040356A6C
MDDYLEDIKAFFLLDYSQKPTSFGQEPIHKTTNEVFNMLKGVIPEHPLTENDIYAFLKESKFEIELVDVMGLVENLAGDKELKVVAQVYKWKMYKRA